MYSQFLTIKCKNCPIRYVALNFLLSEMSSYLKYKLISYVIMQTRYKILIGL
jgi:hypothetical protein